MAGLALPENLPTDPILASGHAPVNLTQALRILTSRRRSATASRQPSAPLPLRQLQIQGKSHRPKAGRPTGVAGAGVGPHAGRPVVPSGPSTGKTGGPSTRAVFRRAAPMRENGSPNSLGFPLHVGLRKPFKSPAISTWLILCLHPKYNTPHHIRQSDARTTSAQSHMDGLSTVIPVTTVIPAKAGIQ